MDIAQIWEKTLISIKNNINSQVSYNVHIKAAKPVSYDASVFTVSVPSSINKNIIEFKYKEPIEASLEIVTGEKISLNIVVGDEIPVQAATLDKITLDNPITLNSQIPIGGVNPKYTFDNFIVGSSNEFANAAAKAVSESPGRLYNPLFIYGNSGLGKTHLIQAIANKSKELHKNMKVLYVTGEKFTTEFIRSLRESSTNEKIMQQFTEKYRTPDILLVDDVQFIAGRERTEEEFFHTFNELFANNKQIVLTSDRKPNDLTTLTDRLRTRFGQGLIIDISAPNYETRVAILQNKAEEYSVKIDDEILGYIAENVKSSIRELESVLQNVVSKSQFQSCEITMDIAKEMVNIFKANDSLKITPQKIIERTAVYYQISEKDITGKTKTKDIAIPRQVAMYICRKLLSLGDTAISKEFDKDRTTVKHNIEKIEAIINTDDTLNSNVNYIIKDIQSR